MWIKKLTSPSSEFPNQIDLIQSLIEQMIKKEVNSCWVHLELVKDGGLFQKIFIGQRPFAEVALDHGNLELNLGHQKNCPEIPSNWQKNKKGLQTIPYSDLTTLCSWIDSFFKNYSDSRDKKISGWIDGL